MYFKYIRFFQIYCSACSFYFTVNKSLLLPGLMKATLTLFFQLHIMLQAYFITNTEPIKFWEFMSLILEGLGYERYSIVLMLVYMHFLGHVPPSKQLFCPLGWEPNFIMLIENYDKSILK